ncbi:MAG: selenide, water dikinase SelD, partial [Acidobacteria bacterium]
MLVVFGSVQRVMRAERIARAEGLDVDVRPAPRSVSSECGMVLEARADQGARLAELLARDELHPQAVYVQRGGAWTLGSLATAGEDTSARLARASVFGGCGAKLAKQTLSTILCGLPRLDSPDLIVGIETADDAGVLRVAADLALIHTVDFFPPIVDDPFSFGRIAAANALSDVYAMGGAPLAGMNLVSFPLERWDRAVLKEILRGGLDALAEAGAVLAGGHTVEGSELLYGMAVTGRVHPERVWRNDTGRAGDVLVLTKPLGTGVITTAARADLVEPDHLTRAVRSMAQLNRAAAEAAREVGPSAVTDVTGFGLVGHAAEMARGAGVTAELDLARLPLLPGAREAAASGLVPAGTAKNRRSVEDELEIDDGVDPILVDLALDPQTSGGLLVACGPDGAQVLCRRL